MSYDGSFSTDTKQHDGLPPGVLLELVHSSGVVTVSEVAGSTKLQVISTMKSLIHDRGPKQSSSGSPCVGSVEGVGDIRGWYYYNLAVSDRGSCKSNDG